MSFILPFSNPNHTYYPTDYNRYCTNGRTVPGEKNVLIGSLYIAQYLVYLCLYAPSLIVIVITPQLLKHACYRLMLCIGLMDNCVGFVFTFMAGVFSLMGANYCDNNMELIVVGHIAHGKHKYLLSG